MKAHVITLLNKNAEKLDLNSPDMVLLFDTYPGWNQVGGSEILTTANHEGEGCNVLFMDGQIYFEKVPALQHLQWKPHEAQQK